MSLITDALQKTQSHSPADRPTGSSPVPPWWSAGVVLGALALLWWWAAHAALGNGQSRSHPASTAALAAATRKPESLRPILSLLPAAPGSPSLTWRIDGVVTGMGTPLAIINGKTVAEGEQMPGGTKVVSVNQQRVQLERESGEVVTVPVESAQ